MSTFGEKVFLILLDRFQELKRMAAAGLPVEIEIEAVQSLLQARLLELLQIPGTEQIQLSEPRPRWSQ